MPNILERFAAARGKPADEAGFYWSGGLVEVADRTWFVSQFSGVTAFDTDEGIVLVDTGPEAMAPLLARHDRASRRSQAL